MSGPVPFELVSVQHSINILYIINLLLLLGAPKVAFPVKLVAGIMLPAFNYQVILPQCTCILPESDRFEIAQHRITDSIVPKVYFPAFLQFIAKIPAEGAQIISFP